MSVVVIMALSHSVCLSVCAGDERLSALGVVRRKRWDSGAGPERRLSSVVR